VELTRGDARGGSMLKWLGVAFAVVLVVAVVLLRGALGGPDEEHLTAARSPVAGAGAPGAAPIAAATSATVAAPATAVAAATHKLDPQSDEFFNRFDDAVPSILTRNAAPCYTGGLSRKSMNAKLKLVFKTHIHNGDVTVENVKVAESTLNDPALEACFIAKVAGARWHDDELPEWTQDDELVIRPERGMKKFTEDNLKYEGTGPVGAAVMTAGQKPAPAWRPEE
jgi:hypothetical protein